MSFKYHFWRASVLLARTEGVQHCVIFSRVFGLSLYQTMDHDTLLALQALVDSLEAKQMKEEKKKKPKPANWFETCTSDQLKALCKASKLQVSGTKALLCQRLLTNPGASKYVNHSQAILKQNCKDKLLVQSGKKFDLILRLLHAEFGTGEAKRAATETITDESTGKQVQVLKKRKTIPSPKALYTRVEKKLKSSSQEKYESKAGYRRHAGDVYNFMKRLIEEHCIENQLVSSDPMLSLDMCKAIFQAFYDHWEHMLSPSYDSDVFRQALDLFDDVLLASRSHLSMEQIEEVVVLLESILSCVIGNKLEFHTPDDPAVYFTTGEGKDGNGWRKPRRPYSTPRNEGDNPFWLPFASLCRTTMRALEQ